MDMRVSQFASLTKQRRLSTIDTNQQYNNFDQQITNARDQANILLNSYSYNEYEKFKENIKKIQQENKNLLKQKLILQKELEKQQQYMNQTNKENENRTKVQKIYQEEIFIFKQSLYQKQNQLKLLQQELPILHKKFEIMQKFQDIQNRRKESVQDHIERMQIHLKVDPMIYEFMKKQKNQKRISRRKMLSTIRKKQISDLNQKKKVQFAIKTERFRTILNTQIKKKSRERSLTQSSPKILNPKISQTILQSVIALNKTQKLRDFNRQSNNSVKSSKFQIFDSKQDAIQNDNQYSDQLSMNRSSILPSLQSDDHKQQNNCKKAEFCVSLQSQTVNSEEQSTKTILTESQNSAKNQRIDSIFCIDENKSSQIEKILPFRSFESTIFRERQTPLKNSPESNYQLNKQNFSQENFKFQTIPISKFLKTNNFNKRKLSIGPQIDYEKVKDSKLKISQDFLENDTQIKGLTIYNDPDCNKLIGFKFLLQDTIKSKNFQGIIHGQQSAKKKQYIFESKINQIYSAMSQAGEIHYLKFVSMCGQVVNVGQEELDDDYNVYSIQINNDQSIKIISTVFDPIQQILVHFSIET